MPDQNKQDLLIETQLFPSIAYFGLLFQAKNIYLEAHENFAKQTYRNRYHLLSSQKVEKLSVPVLRGSSKQKIKEVKIQNDQDWQKQHWRTIKTCYGKAPFFEFFEDEFHPFFLNQYQYLWDYNLDVLTSCLRAIGKTLTLKETTSFKIDQFANVYDFRSLLQPKDSKFIDSIYHSHAYMQNFGNKFVPNLSIIDLLMNEGPNAGTIINNSIKLNKNF